MLRNEYDGYYRQRAFAGCPPVVDLCFGCQCRDILCIWHRQISPNTVSGAYRKRRYLRGLSWVVASEHGVE